MKQDRILNWIVVSTAVILMSFTALHKFYLSVSEVTYSQEEQKIRILSRIFIDDLDAVLKTRYDIDAKLTTEFEHEMAEFYLEKYIKAKLLIKVNDEVVDFNLLGTKVDNDQLAIFIEAPFENIEALQSIFIQNEILMDKFEEQQNIVHLQLKGKKKSFMLIRERSSALLNF